jgi:hypothetical protein
VFLRNGCYHPISYLFATVHPETGKPEKCLALVPQQSPGDEAGKNEYEHTLRISARALKAVGVVFLSEAWS